MSKHKVFWWKEDKIDVHKHVFSTVRTIHQATSDRNDRNIRCLRLYGNQDMVGLGPQSYMQMTSPALPENRVKINIISSMVDTVHSKIGKMKAKVSFLTSGGDFTSQKQAKQLSKWMLGAFYMNKIHEKHQLCFRDSEIFDVGALKHYIQGDRIVSERVLAMELFVDPFDAIYGQPKSMYQVKYIARQTLEALFPDKAGAIKLAKDQIEPSAYNQEQIDEFVTVIEAWHLPSTKDAKDGRHVICIGNDALVDEPYTKSYFPFTFFRWSKPVVGFFGQSLADRLTGNQIEINKMLRIIQRSFHLGSAFKVFLEYGSKVSKEHINNDIGSIIYYMGQKPEFHAPKVVHEEYFRHLQFLIQSAYEEAGVSQLSAAAKKPAGIESGKAIREYNDIETERFAVIAQQYEATFLETAAIYIDLAEELHQQGGDFEVTAQSKSFVESIKWSDVAPADKNAFVMQMFPTSMLPHEPHGRLQFVQELVSSGMIPANYATELLDFPDLESYLSLKNAALDDLMATLEHLLEKGFVPPEPYQDLQTGIPLMQSAYLRAKREGVDEDMLENVRKWINQADALLKRAQTAQGGPQPALPVPPQSAPAPGSEQLLQQQASVAQAPAPIV